MARAMWIVCAGLLLTGARALYSAADDVLVLDDSNFDAHVMKPGIVAAVEYFAPWCGHCQALAPQWKKVAQNLKGIAVVAAVDCNEGSTRRVCERAGVQSFPTIKLYGADPIKNPYTGALSKDGEAYNGARKAKAMVDAISSQFNDLYITRVETATQLQQLGAKAPELAKVLLFTNKRDSSLLFKSLSMRFRNRLLFGLLHEPDNTLRTRFAPEQLPALFVEKPDGTVVPYTGELKPLSMIAFLEQHATPATDAQADAGTGGTGTEGGNDGGGERDGLKLPTVVAANVTATDLERLDADEDMGLLAVYGAEEADACGAEVRAYAQLVQELGGLVPAYLWRAHADEAAAAADALRAYGVDADALAAAPCTLQVVLLPFGEDKRDLEEYERYTGALNATEVSAWVTEKVPDTTSRISTGTFQQFITVGAAPTPDGDKISVPPKVLLFTKKAEPPALFRALAAGLRRKTRLSFGWVQVGSPDSKEVVNSMKVNKVPALVVAISQLSSVEDAQQGRIPLSIQPYPGPPKFPIMYLWLRQMALATNSSNESIRDVLGEEAAAAAAAAAATTGRLVARASNESEFSTACTQRAGICVIGLLDVAHEQHAAHLDTLRAVAAKETSEALHYVWVDAARQPELLASLGVLASELPAVAVLSPKKLLFATSRPPFSQEGARKLVQATLLGKQAVRTLDALPQLRDEAEPEAAAVQAAAAEEAVEEEFDLSDIMSEDIQGSLETKEELLQKAEEELKKEAEAAQKSKRKDKKKKKKKKKKKTSGEAAADKTEL